MRVDYNPETDVVSGLCRVNGHPCWLILDTGWVGMSLYPNRAPKLGAAASTTTSQAAHTRQGAATVRLCLNLETPDTLTFTFPALILASPTRDQTSTGQPISGILGVPFMNIPPIEWNIPAHKIVFWLKGRPSCFRHAPRGAIIQCRRDDVHRLLIPVTVHGRHGLAFFDTGADGFYLFDNLISNFPAVGAEEGWSGPDLHFRFIPRDVKGLKIGPITLAGTVGGRLPRYPTKNTNLPYGLIGAPLFSQTHVFVIGNQIIFDKRLNGTRFRT